MDWPRFQLTPDEKAYSEKYDDPRTPRRSVLSRKYYMELVLSPSLRTDTSSYQISRRSRVVALTAAGDVDRFKVQIGNVTGEQFTTGPTHVPLLLGGYINDPRSTVSPVAGAFRTTDPLFVASPQLGPLVFEPNIVVAPNETLTFTATPADVSDVASTYRLGLTLHVVEFPGMPGSPL